MTHPALPDEPINAFLDDEILEQEFQIFSRYLIGENAHPDYSERYAEACKVHLTDCAPSRALAVVRLRPLTVGPLEAASNVFTPSDELCRKLLIATAVLEAGTDYTDHFLPRQQGVLGILFTLAFQGIRSVIKVLLGLIILMWIGERSFSDFESQKGTETT